MYVDSDCVTPLLFRSPPQTHAAFRGTYMRWLHAFLEELDAESVRRHHRRCTKEMAARMSQLGLSRLYGGCFSLMHSHSSDSLPVSETSQVSAGDRIFWGLGHGFPTSVGSKHSSSIDGLCTSSLCGIGRRASSSTPPVISATSRLDTSGEEDRARLSSPCLNLDGLSRLSGALHRTYSLTPNVMPALSSANTAPFVAIILQSLTRRTKNSNPASKTKSIPQNVQSEVNPAVQYTSRQSNKAE